MFKYYFTHTHEEGATKVQTKIGLLVKTIQLLRSYLYPPTVRAFCDFF